VSEYYSKYNGELKEVTLRPSRSTNPFLTVQIAKVCEIIVENEAMSFADVTCLSSPGPYSFLPFSFGNSGKPIKSNSTRNIKHNVNPTDPKISPAIIVIRTYIFQEHVRVACTTKDTIARVYAG
jgi:hypothetical protein